MRTLLLTITAVLFMSGCKNGEVNVDTRCGGTIHWSDIMTAPLYSSVENGKRIFIYTSDKEPEDICTEDHAKPKFHVDYFTTYIDSIRNGKGDITLTGSVQVPLHQPRTQVMTPNLANNNADTQIEIGLRDVYPDKAGYITMQIIAEFPSRGDFTTDSTYLVNRIIGVQISLDYEKHVE
jgi:hypothetical protein